jgi:hypothetical protein
VLVFEISSRNDAQKARRWSTTALLHFRITGRNHKDKPLPDQPAPGVGFIIFTTHETILRMTTAPLGTGLEEFFERLMLGHGYWPPEAAEFELIIEEEIPTVLTRQPFRLHDNSWLLTSFLAVEAVEVSPLARRNQKARDKAAREAGIEPFDERLIVAGEKLRAKLVNRLAAFTKIVEDGEAKSSRGEVEQAKKRLKKAEADLAAIQAGLTQLYAERADHNTVLQDAGFGGLPRPYFHVRAADNELLRRRVMVEEWDDLYSYLEPLPNWLMSGAALFTDEESWTRMVSRINPTTGNKDYGPLRGRVTISGFRRPD